MKALIQRVSHAKVVVDGNEVGACQRGLLVLLGVEKDDDEARLERLLDKLLRYRVFPDAEGRMNLSVKDIQGELLIVSQFTLAADTRKGTRPGFSSAAPPAEAERLYELFCQRAGEELKVATGQFGADMQVSLLNDGPVTFMLEV
ncbi:MAG: D-aminoacyl-tRNA deacylase [Pseudomonadota bacterium]|nr:D-tyrosyl-tRNA(Tyr) deacylase [Pseudomonas sp.]MEC8443643.1 D-aminoacyl-tRNA deacylase [Pseudomonadota bacterium]